MTDAVEKGWKRHSVETSSFCKAGVASTPPTLQNRKPPFRSFRTPVLSRPPYLGRSKKLTRPLRTKDGAAHGPRCPRLHAAAFEEEGAKRPMAKGGPIRQERV
jgi:hypothetical protein